MSKPTKRRTSPRGRKGEERGGSAPKGPPPLATEWRDERELCSRANGAVDEAAKRRLREWRQKGLTWNREGSDGRIQVACDPTQRDRPWKSGDSAIAGDASAVDTEMQRQIELETRLRQGPYIRDGRWDDPYLRFTLSVSEFEELAELRKAHRCGEDWGTGEERIYWRPVCSDNFVGLKRKCLPLIFLRGKASL